MLNESVHVVVERNTNWEGESASEPYEVGWAKEAIVFLEVLTPTLLHAQQDVRLQLSPDGIRWCDEGAVIRLPEKPGDIAYARISHFGGWLRVTTTLPPGSIARVLVSLHLKS